MTRRFHRLLALAAVLSLLVLTASLPVLAQSGEASGITHRQSVRVEMDPNGSVDSARVFTQLTVQGSGQVEVALEDQATRGLRNLDGFGRPRTDGGQVVYTLDATPDGTHARTVATHRDDLPIELEVSYRLDGQEIAPRDLVGRSGELEVSFTARNTTSTPVEVEYRDGRNVRQRETIDVSVPFVGSISMDLDRRFVDVSAPGASVAGNGRGDTFVSWSMVLFSPVGSEEQTVSYTATVTDAVVPGVVAQFLPVDSNSFTSLASVQETFGGVADGLRDLTGGALQIDSNLNALAAGSAQLLIGVGRLSRGASDLAVGLNETAIPGAAQLADGTGQARDGSQQLAAGLSLLANGAGELSGGLGAARAGGGELAAGLSGRAAPGAAELADGLSSDAAPGAAELEAGLTALLAAFGTADDSSTSRTVLGGVSSLLLGLERELAPGTGAMRNLSGGLAASFGPDSEGNDAGQRAQNAASAAAVISGRTAALAQATVNIEALLEAVQDAGGLSDTQDASLTNARNGLVSPICDVTPPTGPENCGIAQLLPLVSGGAELLQVGLQAQADSLGTWPVSCEAAIGAVQSTPTPTGLQVIRALSCISVSVDDGLTRSVIPGVRLLQGGLDNPACDLTNPTNEANPCGVKQVLGLLEAGSGELTAGLTRAATGAQELASGLADAADGSTELAAGLAQLDEGGQQLAAGASTASTGSRDLASGLGQIDDGADQLASGLGDAGDGASQISEGLETVEGGMTGVADGSKRLVDEGTQVLIGAASDATATPALAVEQAMLADARGQAGEGLPYGTADGAVASAVFQYELAAITGSQDGPSLPLQGGLAVLALGLAVGLTMLVRGRLV